MSATDELWRMLNERGVEYLTDDDERAYDEPARTTWDFVLCGYEMTVTATEFVDVEGKTYLEMDFHHAFTPEQAIAATLGSERDEIYNAGFDNGVKATLHQLDGLLIKTDSAVEIQAWVDKQWKEYES